MLIYTILFCTRPEQEPLHRWRCQNDVEREWITALLQYNFTVSLEWTLINSYRNDAATFNGTLVWWYETCEKVSIPGCLSPHAWAPVKNRPLLELQKMYSLIFILLLMDKILHHQGWWLAHYWQGFNHPRLFRISSINSIYRYLKARCWSWNIINTIQDPEMSLLKMLSCQLKIITCEKSLKARC